MHTGIYLSKYLKKTFELANVANEINITYLLSVYIAQMSKLLKGTPKYAYPCNNEKIWNTNNIQNSTNGYLVLSLFLNILTKMIGANMVNRIKSTI